MPARKTPEVPPPFYVANVDLYLHNDESGAMPVCVERAGGRVSPESVAVHGWHDLVRRPDQGELAAAPPPPPSLEDIPAEPAGSPAEEE